MVRRKPEGYLGDKPLHPETLMMGYGYNPEWSEGALKPPIFQTSTFVFENAAAGKSFFSAAYGLREQEPNEVQGLIYGRINNPNLEILEDRLTLWDEAEACTVFGSGMAAITTTLLTFLRPGDVLLHSNPLYGGTDHFIRHVLQDFGITEVEFGAKDSREMIEHRLESANARGRLAMIYIETPGNPTNALIDIEMCAEIAREYSREEKRAVLAVDNTFLGPVFQHPLNHGADLVLYSATKYIGGHSDLLAGACLGSSELVGRVRAMRTFMGTMCDAWTGWLILRSLETLKIRMVAQAEVATHVAKFLVEHPKIARVYYLGFLNEGDQDYEVYQKQCLGPGSMISFDIRGGEAEAFRFLDALKIVKLAVSLGGTESLAEHPFSMTHCDVNEGDKLDFGISPALVRMSIGIEHPEDIIADIEQALANV
ncbi:MAG TPA: cystathionine gamma-synthase family protein [Nitrolancea sp.]|nr:cystathionine gamma-synthase family protein [Nitrolancea sp.]